MYVISYIKLMKKNSVDYTQRFSNHAKSLKQPQNTSLYEVSDTFGAL